MRNLIRRIISPNQDDLSYSSRSSFPGCRNCVNSQKVSLAEQRRPVQTSRWPFFNNSSSMDAWGNLSNSWIPCVYHLDQGIPVEYELDTFNTPHTGTTLCHPQNWLCRRDASSRSWYLALISPMGYFNGDNARLSPNYQTHKTQGDSKVYFLQRQTRLSLNYSGHHPPRVQRYALLSQLSHNSISSLYSQPFLRDLQHKRKLHIPCCK